MWESRLKLDVAPCCLQPHLQTSAKVKTEVHLILSPLNLLDTRVLFRALSIGPKPQLPKTIFHAVNNSFDWRFCPAILSSSILSDKILQKIPNKILFTTFIDLWLIVLEWFIGLSSCVKYLYGWNVVSDLKDCTW